jgi:hypothetical protein
MSKSTTNSKPSSAIHIKKETVSTETDATTLMDKINLKIDPIYFYHHYHHIFLLIYKL